MEARKLVIIRRISLRSKKGMAVKSIGFLGTFLALILIANPALAGGKFRQISFHRRNSHLAGQLVDYTHNHGEDRRIWSNALGERFRILDCSFAELAARKRCWERDFHRCPRFEICRSR